jgi:hypothetical protein
LFLASFTQHNGFKVLKFIHSIVCISNLFFVCDSWWHIPIIIALGHPRQEDLKVKGSMVYIAIPNYPG